MSKKQEYLDKVGTNALKGEDIIFLIEVLDEMSKENKDILEILADLKEAGENFLLNFEIGTHKAFLEIQEGIVSTGKYLRENPIVTIIMNEDAALELLLGKNSMANLYKEKRINFQGNIMKVAALSLMWNIVMDELGIM
jgi:alkyl sulfatase BDS1-like metallo-beta-lactamase superfamily hydrolase